MNNTELGKNKKFRYGKIVITEEVYEEFWNTIKNIIPYRIEYFITDRSFHVECQCPFFDEIEEGEIVPEYYIKYKIITCDPLENYGMRQKKIIDKIVRIKQM